jgi:ribose/xylose/arabinose/galactoside ABC-type transport system permease subunit
MTTEEAEPVEIVEVPAPPRTRGVATAVKRFGLVGFLIIMVVVFSVASPDVFFTKENFQSIGQTNSVIAL